MLNTKFSVVSMEKKTSLKFSSSLQLNRYKTTQTLFLIKVGAGGIEG